jgi:hypothetical protein
MAVSANVSRPKRIEVSLTEGTTSIASSPIAAQVIAPISGVIARVVVAASGTFTGTINVTVSVNGGADVTSGNLNLPAQTGSVNGVTWESPVYSVADGFHVNEGDIIVLTPSGGTGASIGGAFTVVLRNHV